MRATPTLVVAERAEEDVAGNLFPPADGSRLGYPQEQARQKETGKKTRPVITRREHVYLRCRLCLGDCGRIRGTSTRGRETRLCPSLTLWVVQYSYLLPIAIVSTNIVDNLFFFGSADAPLSCTVIKAMGGSILFRPPTYRHKSEPHSSFLLFRSPIWVELKACKWVCCCEIKVENLQF